MNIADKTEATEQAWPLNPDAASWFDNALRYMRGDPAFTDCVFDSNSVFADFVKYWDSQDFHFRSTVGSLFRAAPYFFPNPASEDGPK